MGQIRASSAWDEAAIASFLETTVIPIRLACNAQAAPLICSLWYLFDDGALWCATQQSASIVRLLENDPAVGFEVAPEAMPYRGVRGQGKASLSPGDGAAVLGRLLDRYVGGRDSRFAQGLLRRAATEVAIRIDPDWLTSWDFSARMRG